MKNWFKKYEEYIWFSLITALSSFLGAAIVYLIPKNNFGSIADWVSGIGSLGAIIVALWQIYEQKNEYKNDRNNEKEKEKFSNRAYFTITYSNHVYEKEEIVYNNKYRPIRNFFEYRSDKKIFYTNGAMNLIRIKNCSNANAINCFFKVEYNDNSSDILSFENLEPGGKKTIIADKIIDEPSSDMPQLINAVEIHFDSIRNEHYVQHWDKKEKHNILDLSDSEINDVEKENDNNGLYYSITEALIP